jgi:hypothetical protein
MIIRRRALVAAATLALVIGLTLPAAAALTAYGVVTKATAGTPFNGYVAYFTSDRTNTQPEEISATIFWGDGTFSPGMITADENGRFFVHGTHVYPNWGTYNVQVQLVDTVLGYTTSRLRPGLR